MTNYEQTVRLAEAQLTDEGRLVATSDPEQAEQKSLITRRAAYLISLQDPNVGLLRKDAGAQFLGLSTDTLLDRSDGTWSDVASSRAIGGGLYQAFGTWQPNATISSDPDWLARWVQPTKELAEIVEDGAGGGDGSGDGSGDDGEAPIDPLVALEILQRLEQLLEATARIEASNATLAARLNAHMSQPYTAKVLGQDITSYPNPV